MRTIKFRAWDKIRKEMFVPSHLDRINGNDYFTTQRFTVDPPDEFELMQFTGLHDRNGREIYEGDIVIHRMYIPLSIDSIFELERMKIDVERYGWAEAPGHGFEVIGNLYENPELLTK